MKTLLLSAAFAALALGANAQTAISFGVEAGANLSNLRITSMGEKETSSTKAGIRGGVFANIGIGEQLAIQPGIYYSQKGGKKDNDIKGIAGIYTQTSEISISYIEVPINVIYHFNNEQTGFFLGAGAYGGLAIGGKQKLSYAGTVPTGTTGVDRDLSIGSDEAKDDIRRFDLGFQAGAGYQTKMGLMFRAQYMLGAMNITNYNNSDNALRNGAIALTVGYRFGGR